jgi:hypothetical protein
LNGRKRIMQTLRVAVFQAECLHLGPPQTRQSPYHDFTRWRLKLCLFIAKHGIGFVQLVMSEPQPASVSSFSLFCGCWSPFKSSSAAVLDHSCLFPLCMPCLLSLKIITDTTYTRRLGGVLFLRSWLQISVRRPAVTYLCPAVPLDRYFQALE